MNEYVLLIILIIVVLIALYVFRKYVDKTFYIDNIDKLDRELRCSKVEILKSIVPEIKIDDEINKLINQNKLIMSRNFKRRNRLDLQTKTERTINDAISQIEEMGADERLTNAVILLEDARNSLADYVDDQLKIALND